MRLTDAVIDADAPSCGVVVASGAMVPDGEHVRAFAPFALPFLALAVMSATIWRTWVFRASAIPFAIIGLIGAAQGPRYDVIVAPSGDQAAVHMSLAGGKPSCGLRT